MPVSMVNVEMGKIDIKPLDHLVYTSPPKRNSESSHGLDLLDVENVYL